MLQWIPYANKCVYARVSWPTDEHPVPSSAPPWPASKSSTTQAQTKTRRMKQQPVSTRQPQNKAHLLIGPAQGTGRDDGRTLHGWGHGFELMDEFEWGCNSNKCDENQSGERCADLVRACDDRRIRKREILRKRIEIPYAAADTASKELG